MVSLQKLDNRKPLYQLFSDGVAFLRPDIRIGVANCKHRRRNCKHRHFEHQLQ